MASKSSRKVKSSLRPESSAAKFLKNPKVAFAFVLVLLDAFIVSLIIARVPYTKIDWDAYMSQVSGFLGGERDYRNLKGDTGPLVYPAGFLYIYSAIQYVSGGEVYPAQLPWWALVLLCLSKRVHSIFVLRLFNDCFAMTLLHAMVAFLLCQQWHLALILFSGAVSIKMNVLLYAPSLLLLMLKAMNVRGVISALAGAALVQILLGLPFLVSHPISYISRAFNLGRVFIHFWSVNFKFVPEPFFVSKPFAAALLIAHLGLLMAFAHYRWCKDEGGLLIFLRSRVLSKKLLPFLSNSGSSSIMILKEEYVVTNMFTGNFIGIICARSLHYQFYSWYFYSLPFLLWRTTFPTVLRLILFMGVEFCWNIYPSNVYSSALLLCFHLLILWGLWSAPSEYPYIHDKSSTRQKDK